MEIVIGLIRCDPSNSVTVVTKFVTFIPKLRARVHLLQIFPVWFHYLWWLSISCCIERTFFYLFSTSHTNACLFTFLIAYVTLSNIIVFRHSEYLTSVSKYFSKENNKQIRFFGVRGKHFPNSSFLIKIRLNFSCFQ